MHSYSNTYSNRAGLAGLRLSLLCFGAACIRGVGAGLNNSSRVCKDEVYFLVNNDGLLRNHLQGQGWRDEVITEVRVTYSIMRRV